MYEKETSNNSVRSIRLVEETKSRVGDYEARDFDHTIDALVNFPGDDADKLYLCVKGIRRWPKAQVQVEYPPSQCAAHIECDICRPCSPVRSSGGESKLFPP